MLVSKPRQFDYRIRTIWNKRNLNRGIIARDPQYLHFSVTTAKGHCPALIVTVYNETRRVDG